MGKQGGREGEEKGWVIGRAGLTKRVPVSKTLIEGGQDLRGKSVPERGSSMCKGPEAEVYLVF